MIDVSLFAKRFSSGLFLDAVEARSFKLCRIITLFGVYQFIPGLMTLTLFSRSQVCQNHNLQIVFLKWCLVCSLNVLWLLYIKKIVHSVFCLTQGGI